MEGKITKMSTKLCKKPGRDTFAAMSKEERKKAHQDRVVRKRQRDAQIYQKAQQRPTHIYPNLSKNHPRRYLACSVAYNVS